MNNYKSFSKLKEELGDNYDFKLYEMGISALKETENLQQENKQLKDNWNKLKEELIKIRQLTFTKYNKNEWANCLSFNDDILPLIKKMQEKEQGSDSNE